MSAQAGWYPDPGGVPNLYRYWDGRAWSAVTSPSPAAPAPSIGLVDPAQDSTAAQQANAAYGSSGSGYGQQAYGPYQTGGAYANYQQAQKKKSPVGWWVAAAALVVVLVIIGVFAVRAVTGGGGIAGSPTGQGTDNACPQAAASDEPTQAPNDGRVHGGPVSYPELGSPWSAPEPDPQHRVPFGVGTQEQTVTVEPNYNGDNSSWVASILVAQLQAGDGFFTPEQGAQIVVRCILGTFYGDNPVNSNVTVNKAMTIDGKSGWIVESKLTFDIPNLRTKGELLIVAIVPTGATAGLFYASIPDTTPQLVAPARQALAQLQVDG